MGMDMYYIVYMLTVISEKQFLKEIQKRKYKYCVASKRTI